MAYCKICGDESNLTAPFRFWSPDDGYLVGRMCKYCFEDHGHRKPRPEDYAYRERGEFTTDEQGAIDELYG